MFPREQEIIKVARRWIGTPYLHQASALNHGADCLGLIRGVWRSVVGDEPEEIPAYTADWSEVRKEEQLWEAVLRHLIPMSQCTDFTIANVILFRMSSDAMAKHLGIYSFSRLGGGTLIHAYSGCGVVETPLTASWRRRAVAQFCFPDRRK